MGGRLSCGGRSSRRENERSRKSSGCFTLRNSRGNVKARAECHRKTRNRPGSHIYKKQLSRDDPSLLSSAVLINSWKAPSISSMPDTPVSELSSSTKFNCDRPSLSQPTNEMLMQIIRCFPFDVASTYSSPRGSPTASRHVKSANFAAIEVDGMVRRTASWHGTKKLKTSLSNIVRRKTEATFLYVDSETKIAKTKSAIEKLAQVSADTMAITALPLDCWLKERLKNWVQLSGHEGSIVPATDRTLWKRRSCIGYNEGDAYERLSKDALLVGLIPKFYQQREYKDEKFIEIEDLTSGFRNPAVMDVKMGTRTFLECEVKNEKLRSDLYEKMIAIDANEPTEEEHLAKAITKLRYMQFRESESSTATLGFRIEAAKTPDDILKKSFKKVKTKEEVMAAFMAFFGRKSSTLCPQLLVRLRQIRDAIERSTFFKHHEVVGSSLLFVYDENNVGVWMIDFAKTLPIEGRVISHRIPWKMGNHEDGYLIGLNSLIEIFEELSQKR